MCGIIGCSHQPETEAFLHDAIRVLETRGYDSMGTAVFPDYGLGPELPHSESVLGSFSDTAYQPRGYIGEKSGLGHNRWASQGEITLENTHPVNAGNLYLVENGDVMYYDNQLAELKADGVELQGETDAEFLVHWIKKRAEDNGEGIFAAMQTAVTELEGEFAIALVDIENPDEILIAKKGIGNPVVVGRNEQSSYVASEAKALQGHATEFTFLQSDEFAICSGSTVKIYDAAGNAVERNFEALNLEEIVATKAGYPDFMIKEINDQPESVSTLLKAHILDGVVEIPEFPFDELAARDLREMHVLAAGTSFFSGLLAKRMLPRFVDLRVTAHLASEFLEETQFLRFYGNEVAVFPSQSGETAESVKAMQPFLKARVPVIGMVNEQNSTLERMADSTIPLLAGHEEAIASTKAYTSQVAAFYLIGLALNQQRGESGEADQEILSALASLPNDIAKSIRTIGSQIPAVVQKLKPFSKGIFMARGSLDPAAREGALKFTEVTRSMIRAVPAGEVKHGVLGGVDRQTLGAAFMDSTHSGLKTRKNFNEIRKQHGGMLAIHTDDMDPGDVNWAIEVPTVSPWTQPLIHNIASQLLSYHVGVDRGVNVDRPAGLTKAVTVE